jgi:hypothetical protein
MRQDTNLDTLGTAKAVPKQEKRERRNYDFSYGISVGYLDNFDDLNDLNLERIPLGGSMKFLTTFVGRVLPLSRKEIHSFTTVAQRPRRY